MIENKTYDIFEINKKLLGDITPYGDTAIDEKRLEKNKNYTICFEQINNGSVWIVKATWGVF